MSSTGKQCDYPGCGKNTPWTDWTRCEEHNGKPACAWVANGCEPCRLDAPVGIQCVPCREWVTTHPSHAGGR